MVSLMFPSLYNQYYSIISINSIHILRLNVNERERDTYRFTEGIIMINKNYF